MSEKQVFPDHLDSTIIGFGVTYWPERDRKYLLQYSRVEPSPSFEVVRGVRRKISPSFDVGLLYEQSLRCALSDELPQAGHSLCPVISIGLAHEKMNLYSRIPLDERTLAEPQVAAIKGYLEIVLEPWRTA